MPDVTRRSLRRVLSLVTASLCLASAGDAIADRGGSFDVSSGPDETPPVFVIPPMFVEITHESISVRVLSDEVATVALSYSIGDEIIGQVESLEHQTDHLIHVSGLTPGTVYTVSIVMHDPVWNNSEEEVRVVVTLPAPDVTPPLFFTLPLLALTHESVSIALESDELATVVLTYSAGDDGLKKVVTTAPQRVHTITVINLVPETTYTLVFVLYDSEGNVSEAVEQVITTLPGPDITPPVFIGQPLLALTHESVSIDVESDELATVVVTYSAGNDNLQQVVSAAPQRVHLITLTDLLPGTTYTLTILLHDMAGNVSKTVEQVITTKAIIVSVTDAVPTKFALNQNAPNPFNPSTTIQFSVAKSTPVILAIYSTTGQLIRTLVDGAMTAGTHQITWDGTDNTGRSVASGIYLYRLRTSDQVASKRLTLVR
jgi:hypothetical protein